MEEENIIDFQPIAQETPGYQLPVNDEDDSNVASVVSGSAPNLGRMSQVREDQAVEISMGPC